MIPLWKNSNKKEKNLKINNDNYKIKNSICSRPLNLKINYFQKVKNKNELLMPIRHIKKQLI
jgi:hypothetical protein